MVLGLDSTATPCGKGKLVHRSPNSAKAMFLCADYFVLTGRRLEWMEELLIGSMKPIT